MASTPSGPRAFGWHAIAVDGHDVEEIDAAFAEATATTGKPTVVIARTIKGKGVAAVENANGFHGKPLDDPDAAIAELGGLRNIRVEVSKPEPGEAHRFATSELALPRYELGAEVATRKAYGEALAAVGSARGDVVALDGEVSNSTFAEIFGKAHPDRYFEMYIAEQQLVAAAVGLQARGWRPFASTFAAFFSRAYDFVRMAADQQSELRPLGLPRRRLDRRGRAVADGARGHRRVSRGARKRRPPPVRREPDREARGRARRSRRDRLHPHAPPCVARLVRPDEEFEIGGSRVLRSSDDDDVAIVAAGITLHEALAAAEVLAGEGIAARVVDLYSIKPLDRTTLLAAAEATDGRVVTVEDHWPEGGLGEAVAAALAEAGEQVRVVSLAVRGMPSSGKPDELLAAAGIDADAITAAARLLVPSARVSG